MLPADARILVIAVARIGDTLLVTPGLRALRGAAPQGRLTMLAHPGRAPVLTGLSFIDVLATITKRSAFWRARLSAERHDVAFVYGRDTALLRYALRCAREAVVFDHPEFSGVRGPVVRVPLPRESLHAVRERLLLPEACGVRARDLRLAYSVSDTEKAAAIARVTSLVGTQRPLVGLLMQSFPTKAHRDWPVGHFAAFAARIAERWPQAHFLLFGDAAGARAAQPVADALGSRCSLVAGTLALRESAALIAQLDLYVGVDTGPTHLAGALGVPMVALYHWAYPGRYLAPLDHPACRVIEHPATGRGSGDDMSAIPVDAVCEAAEALLAARMQGR